MTAKGQIATNRQNITSGAVARERPFVGNLLNRRHVADNGL
jgi:hypothetical protein